MLRFIPCVIFLALLSCDKKAIIDREFAFAYAELVVAQHEFEETENGKAARFQILKHHGLTLETFEQKIRQIKDEPANWMEFQKTVVDILDSMRTQ